MKALLLRFKFITWLYENLNKRGVKQIVMNSIEFRRRMKAL